MSPSLGKGATEDMKPPNLSEDATIQTQTCKTVVSGENSADGRIQDKKHLKDTTTPSETTRDKLHRSNFFTKSVQTSERSSETHKHSETLDTAPTVTVPCDGSLQLITSRDIKPSGNFVPVDNSSTDSIKHSITTEQSQSHNIKTNYTIVAGNNPSTDSIQYLITTEDWRLQNTKTSEDTVPRDTLSINSFRHSITTEDPKSYNTEAGDSIVPGDNPSTDYIQHLIATEVPNTYTIPSDFLPGDGSSIDSIQHLITTEDPNTCTKTSDDIVQVENLSADPPQQMFSAEDPKTHHMKTRDDVAFADNPSTEHLELMVRAQYQKTDHVKTSSVNNGETGTLSINVITGSRPVHNETVPLKDSSIFVGTPFKEGTQTSSLLRTTQHRNVPYVTPVGINECRKLHNKLCPTVKQKTRQSQNRRTYTFARPITKKEVELALPRKSFFSCHEKALKEAGYEVHAKAADKDRANPDTEKRTLPTEADSSSLQLMESPNDGFPNNIKIVITNASENDVSKIDRTELDHVETVNKHNEKATLKVPEVEKMAAKVSDPTKQQSYAMKSKRPETAKIEYFECKPLRKYLEYVKENEPEYLQSEQSSRINTVEQSGSSSLLKLGRAFELRNHGGKMRPRDETLVLASRALRPRTADFDKFNKYRDADTWITETTVSMLKQQNKRSHDKNTPAMVAMPTVNTEANPKPELEKLKQKAEEWCKSVSTNTVVRAKLWSLKQLGTDDIEVTNWSEAFQNCGYIRQVRL